MGKRLYSLVMFLVVSVLGGLLVAGLGVPAAGIASDAGKAGVAALDTLPAELETPPQAERSRVLMSDGSLLSYFYNENRVYRPLNEISLIMRQAQVGIEDHRFYEHGAMDLTATLRALVSNARGVTQGASTLTQQYVKLVQVSAAEARGDKLAMAKAQENTVTRKVQELRYAIAVEKRLTKDEILERYLNIAYYGGGAYGVEAAARHYFNVSSSKLTLAQAALLSGLVRNPVGTDPVRFPHLALERRNNVLDRLASNDVKLITVEEAEKAKAEGLKLKVTKSRLGCANSPFPLVCQYVEKSLLASPSLGPDEASRKDVLYRGGLTIQTQINPKVQRAAEKAIAARFDPRDPVISVMAMIQPGTGQILAMAQSRPKMGGAKQGGTYYNYAVTAKMGGAEGYQGGSTFKAFTAAAALDNDFAASQSYNSPGTKDFTGQIFKSCEGNFRSSKFPVTNAGSRSYGNINMFQAATNSVNTYFVQLEQDVGLCEVTGMAEKLGLKLALGGSLKERFQYIPSFTLGAAEISPLSMAEAYATFAARGLHCNAVIISAIKAKDGTNFEVPSANCKQVIDKSVADVINKVFQGPFTSGTARPAAIPGYQMAGKTGTEDGNRAIWTVGYTPEIVGAAMIAKDKANTKFWKARRYALRGARMPYSGTYISGSSGTEAGGWIFRPSMAAAIRILDIKPRAFAEPGQEALYGKRTLVPSCSGLGISACEARLKAAGFKTGKIWEYSNYGVGALVGLTPTGQQPKNTKIYLRLSRGPAPQKPSPTPTKSTAPTPTPTKKGRKP
ncbi:MAG: transglycosylase domain-containing protein [Micropruina sp.]